MRLQQALQKFSASLDWIGATGDAPSAGSAKRIIQFAGAADQRIAAIIRPFEASLSQVLKLIFDHKTSSTMRL
jgi:hypothetical protein